MSARKSELRATLMLTLTVVCLLPAAAASVGDASSPHHDGGGCPSKGVAADCKACSERSSDDGQSDVDRCCVDVLVYSTCRDQLDAAAVQSKSLAKRSVDDFQLLDRVDEKRKTPFLGKRARNPFLGKRRVNPFLGKRRNPFLGKRTPYDLDEVLEEKRRMPFLG